MTTRCTIHSLHPTNPLWWQTGCHPPSHPLSHTPSTSNYPLLPTYHHHHNVLPLPYDNSLYITPPLPQYLLPSPPSMLLNPTSLSPAKPASTASLQTNYHASLHLCQHMLPTIPHSTPLIHFTKTLICPPTHKTMTTIVPSPLPLPPQPRYSSSLTLPFSHTPIGWTITFPTSPPFPIPISPKIPIQIWTDSCTLWSFPCLWDVSHGFLHWSTRVFTKLSMLHL